MTDVSPERGYKLSQNLDMGQGFCEMQISKQVTDDKFIEWTTLLWQDTGIVEQSYKVNGIEIWKGGFSVKDYGMEWDPWGENQDASQMLMVKDGMGQDEDESSYVAVISMLVSFAMALSIYGIKQGKRQAIAHDVDDSYIRA